MEYLVVHFPYDNIFQAVSQTKITACNGDVLVKGSKCQVPFETQQIDDEGKNCLITIPYEGTIFCVGQGKKKAEELAKKNQKLLDDGTSLDMSLESSCQPNKKRNASSKLEEALKELKDPEKETTTENKKKKVSQGSTNVSTEKNMTNGDSPRKKKKSKKPKSPVKTKDCQEGSGSKSKKITTCIHPEKMAEITEILGYMSTPKKDLPYTTTCPASISKSSPASSIVQSSQIPHLTPKKLVPVAGAEFSPRRSPRIHQLKQTTKLSPLVLSQKHQYEDISPVRSIQASSMTHVKNLERTYQKSATCRSPLITSNDCWDGLIVDSVNMVDSYSNYSYHDMDAPIGHFQTPAMPAATTTKAQAICDLIGINVHEANLTQLSTVLRKIADALDPGTPCNNYDVDNSHIHVHRPSPQFVTNPIVQDVDPAGKKSPPCTDNDQPNSHTFKQIKERNPDSSQGHKSDDKQLAMLIKDCNDPDRFKDVLVVKSQERSARLTAKSSKKPGIALLNGILSCVFTHTEMGLSTGVGARRKVDKKGNLERMNPLNPLKIEAIREYMQYHCMKEGWAVPTTVEFNTTITNKITNCRKRLQKQPELKKTVA